jgi:hypothetical protein
MTPYSKPYSFDMNEKIADIQNYYNDFIYKLSIAYATVEERYLT